MNCPKCGSLIDAVQCKHCGLTIDSDEICYLGVISRTELREISNLIIDTEAAEQAALQASVDAQIVIDLINSIPTFSFTEEFRSDLQRARTAYNALTPKVKQMVTNYQRLQAEEERFETLRNQVTPVKSNVTNERNNSVAQQERVAENPARDRNEIPTQESIIQEANAVFDAVSQLFSSNERSEQDDEHRGQDTAAERVSHLIGRIGMGNARYTDAFASQLREARAAYDALTQEQKSHVEHYSWLTIAESDYSHLRAEAQRTARTRRTRISIIAIFAVLVIAGVIAGFIGKSRKTVDDVASPQERAVFNINDEQSLAALSTAQRGDRIFFGRYEQDNNLENGTEPIEWVVLQNNSGTIFASTLYCIDDKAYNEGNDWGETNWESCTLRAWLNDEFYMTAFTDWERQLLLRRKFVSPDAGTDNSLPDEVIIDRVSLLGMTDIVDLYPGYDYAETVTFYDKDKNPLLTTSMSTSAYEELSAFYTEYARAQHLRNETISNGENAAQRYETVTEAEFGKGSCAWWLHDEGYKAYEAMEIIWNGAAISAPAHAHIGVRPVIGIGYQ